MQNFISRTTCYHAPKPYSLKILQLFNLNKTFSLLYSYKLLYFRFNWGLVRLMHWRFITPQGYYGNYKVFINNKVTICWKKQKNRRLKYRNVLNLLKMANNKNYHNALLVWAIVDAWRTCGHHNYQVAVLLKFRGRVCGTYIFQNTGFALYL